jgi:hypothetical protein
MEAKSSGICFARRFCRHDGFSVVFAHCEVEGLASINVLPGFGFPLGMDVSTECEAIQQTLKTTAKAKRSRLFSPGRVERCGPPGIVS